MSRYGILGMCARCGWLAHCEERENARKRRILVCEECMATEGDRSTAKPMARAEEFRPMKPVLRMKRRGAA